MAIITEIVMIIAPDSYMFWREQGRKLITFYGEITAVYLIFVQSILRIL